MLIKKYIIKWGKVVFCMLLLLILLIVISNTIIEKAAQGKTYSDVESIPYNEVGVLLGTSKYKIKGGINPYFKYRVKAAVRLYRANKIKYILISGSETQYYKEPKSFAVSLIEKGIPKDKIYLDGKGFRTLASIVRAKEVYGLTKFTLISQQFHNERAVYLAQHYAIDAIGFNAQDVTDNYGLFTNIREYFARCKALLDVIIGNSPSISDSVRTIPR